jgi:hypothetical protein
MLNATDIGKFQVRLRGGLIRPGDQRYEEARKVFNGMIDRRPALIVRCAGVADVIAAVNFARETDTLMAIRGGGHNVAGNAVCDDGLVIDLSAMKSVRVDPKNRTAGPRRRHLGRFDLKPGVRPPTRASFPTPESQDSPWAAASATSTESMASPAITWCLPTW